MSSKKVKLTTIYEESVESSRDNNTNLSQSSKDSKSNLSNTGSIEFGYQHVESIESSFSRDESNLSIDIDMMITKDLNNSI